MLAKTIIITEPASTGVQNYTSIGFQGKLLLIQAVNRGAAGTGGGAGWMFGAASSTTNRWVACGRSDNAAAAINSGSRRNNNLVILIANVAGTAAASADFNGWLSNGFSLNWSNVQDSAREYIVTVLGGDDFEGVVGQSTTPGATGTQSVTGLAFEPNALLLFDVRLNNTATGTSTFYRPQFAFFDEAGNGGGWGADSQDTSDPSITARVQNTTGSAATGSSSGDLDRRAALSSYNSDGFTLNWTVLDPTVGVTTKYQYVAMQVPKSVKGSISTRTTTGLTTVSGLGHMPQLILLGGIESAVAEAAGHNFALGMVGGAGPTDQAVVAEEDQDNVGTTNASTKWAEGKAINFISANGASPTDDIVANVSDIDFGEFTLNYTVVLGTAVTVQYLSIGTVEQTISSSFTVDSIVKKNIASSLTLNSIVKATRTGSVTLNAIVKAKVNASATADAIVKKNIASSATLDAIVKITPTQTVSLNAIVKATVAGSFTIDADSRRTGRPTWTTPENMVGITSEPTLTFLMPAAVADMHFQIELDTVNTFDSGDLVTYDSQADQTGWEYWNGSTWTAVPSSGVPNTFSGNEARLNVPDPLDPGLWYRRVRAGA